jgi:hypothetical protein
MFIFSRQRLSMALFVGRGSYSKLSYCFAVIFYAIAGIFTSNRIEYVH